MCLSKLDKYSTWAPLFLRLALGAVFIAHGADKLFGGIPGTAQFFAGLSIPLPGIAAWVVALVEFFGGIALVIGLFTRYAGLLLAVNMLVALFTAHLKDGVFTNYELPMVLLAGAIALTLRGSGKLAIDNYLKIG
ncbi:DoxX family protein [Candidatus Woesearchaeota archaeon]|nr:DoxX family protein [Candidatus Woesearchaeota archaeon]